MKVWHDNDAFWTKMAPFMFGESAWAAAPAQVDELLSLAGTAPGTAVLDLGCGPGRHALELARRGFQVTGLDRTADYLDLARAAAAAENLDLEFVQGDIRTFQRAESFELAISLFTSFGYFDDPQENLAVLHNAFLSLAPGGVLVLELSGKEVLARIFQERDWDEIDGVYLLQERRPVDSWRRMQARWILIEGGAALAFEFEHWLYSAAELSALLREAGFAEVRCFGALDGRPYDLQATRLVAVARKQDA